MQNTLTPGRPPGETNILQIRGLEVYSQEVPRHHVIYDGQDGFVDELHRVISFRLSHNAGNSLYSVVQAFSRRTTAIKMFSILLSLIVCTGDTRFQSIQNGYLLPNGSKAHTS